MHIKLRKTKRNETLSFKLKICPMIYDFWIISFSGFLGLLLTILHSSSFATKLCYFDKQWEYEYSWYLLNWKYAELKISIKLPFVFFSHSWMSVVEVCLCQFLAPGLKGYIKTYKLSAFSMLTRIYLSGIRRVSLNLIALFC